MKEKILSVSLVRKEVRVQSAYGQQYSRRATEEELKAERGRWIDQMGSDYN